MGNLAKYLFNGLMLTMIPFQVRAFDVHWDFTDTIYHDVAKDEVLSSGELEIQATASSTGG